MRHYSWIQPRAFKLELWIPINSFHFIFGTFRATTVWGVWWLPKFSTLLWFLGFDRGVNVLWKTYWRYLPLFHGHFSGLHHRCSGSRIQLPSPTHLSHLFLPQFSFLTLFSLIGWRLWREHPSSGWHDPALLRHQSWCQFWDLSPQSSLHSPPTISPNSRNKIHAHHTHPRP